MKLTRAARLLLPLVAAAGLLAAGTTTASAASVVGTDSAYLAHLQQRAELAHYQATTKTQGDPNAAFSSFFSSTGIQPPGSGA